MVSTTHRKTKKRSLLINSALTLLSVAFWIFIWAIAARRIGVEVILPSPVRVLERLRELMGTQRFWSVSARSLLHVITGFASGALIGTTLAILTHVVHPMKVLLSPMLTVIKTTPVASFVILALIFIGSSSLPPFISAIIVIPIVYGNVCSGLESIDGELREVARLYDLGFFKRVRILYFPALKPHLFPALTTSLGLAWKSGISAEVIANSRRSIGNMLYESKIYIETADLFAWTLVVIVMSLLLEAILKSVERAVRSK